MKKFEKIIEELNTQEITNEDFIHSDMINPLPNVGKWKSVNRYGGEGQGNSYWNVIYFEDQDVYVRLDGFYSSYNGVDVDDAKYTEVKPKQKTITVYT